MTTCVAEGAALTQPQVHVIERRLGRATGQGLAISAVLFGFASAVGGLAGTTLGWAEVWSAVTAILSAIVTALAAYMALFAFEQQSKIYGDAARAVRAASRPTRGLSTDRDGPNSGADVTQFVGRVEDVMRQERAQ